MIKDVTPELGQAAPGPPSKIVFFIDNQGQDKSEIVHLPKQTWKKSKFLTRSFLRPLLALF